MPFDQTGYETTSLLSPAVADLMPRERLERLRLWLLTSDAGNNWNYTVILRDCGTVGCAWGQYRVHVFDDRSPMKSYYVADLMKEFDISDDQQRAIFFSARWYIIKSNTSPITPADVAVVIGMVQRGEIE